MSAAVCVIIERYAALHQHAFMRQMLEPDS